MKFSVLLIALVGFFVASCRDRHAPDRKPDLVRDFDMGNVISVFPYSVALGNGEKRTPSKMAEEACKKLEYAGLEYYNEGYSSSTGFGSDTASFGTQSKKLNIWCTPKTLSKTTAK